MEKLSTAATQVLGQSQADKLKCPIRSHSKFAGEDKPDIYWSYWSLRSELARRLVGLLGLTVTEAAKRVSASTAMADAMVQVFVELGDYMWELDNPVGVWIVEVVHYGKTRLDAIDVIEARTGDQLLKKIMPHQDNEFGIYLDTDMISIRNIHKDNPDGTEWFRIYPAKVCAQCLKNYLERDDPDSWCIECLTKREAIFSEEKQKEQRQEDELVGKINQALKEGKVV